MKFIFFLFSILISSVGISQEVYKTPSGKKYHLKTCRMVENVSAKLLGDADINQYKLTPCKICKPPAQQSLKTSYTSANKAVGQSESVQCVGKTQRGTRCKHVTKLANGYCYQHTKQNSTDNNYLPKSYKSVQTNTLTTTCGAKNKTGGYCKRKVKGGGKCYQHK